MSSVMVVALLASSLRHPPSSVVCPATHGPSPGGSPVTRHRVIDQESPLSTHCRGTVVAAKRGCVPADGTHPSDRHHFPPARRSSMLSVARTLVLTRGRTNA